MPRPLLDGLAPDPATLALAPAAPRRAFCELDQIPRGVKVLWVTSSGGHLAEVAVLARLLDASDDSLWVTFDTPQTAGFLADRRRHYVDYVPPRDLLGALRAARTVLPLLQRERFHVCLSTGAAIAATVLPLAARAGIPTYYVESLARPHGPSVTGRLLARAPGVRTLTQYVGWSSPAWPYTRSALEGWEAVDQPGARDLPEVPRPLKILVTLGTIAPYRFDRAVDAVLSLLRPGDEVVWQLGATTRPDLPGEVHREVAPERLVELTRAADVVVTHGGVGSILQQFELGRCPVLAVRRHAHGEHVDDHQQGFAETTAERGLTSILDLDDPRREVLEYAARRRVRTRPVRRGPSLPTPAAAAAAAAAAAKAAA